MSLVSLRKTRLAVNLSVKVAIPARVAIDSGQLTTHQHRGGHAAWANDRALRRESPIMTRCFDMKTVIAALMVVFVAPNPVRAQASLAKAGATPTLDSLSGQEREILDLALDFSRRCQDTLEKWIASGEVTEEKLFSRLYYPIPKTDPPKFNTDWDKLSDRDILPIEETVKAKNPAILFATVVDASGYLPTHNQEFSRALTGDPSVDLNWNRTKRIFNDRTGLAAAKNTAPFLLQVYQRDTGEKAADLSVPLIVRGKHWGAVRIGYRIRD
jgi:methyl-accepting chemotaxis protein